jgi:hypothetical protein
MIHIEELARKDRIGLIFSFILLMLLLILPTSNPISLSQTDDHHLSTAINTIFNSYFYLTSLGQFLASDYGVKVLLLLGITSSYLCLVSYKAESVSLLSSVILAWTFLVLCFGYSFSSLGVIGFIPIFVLCINSLKRFSIASASLLLLITITAWLCIFNFALLALILAIAICVIFQRDNLNFNKHACISIFMTFMLLFTMNAFAPNLPWPDYPAAARLTQLFDAPAWFARPLIGPDLPIPVIDRLSLRQNLAPFILPCSVCILLLGIIKPRKVLATLGLILALLYLDLNISENISQIAPIQSAARILPGLAQTATSPILLSLVLLSLSVFIGNNFYIGVLAQVIVCLSSYFLFDNTALIKNQFSSTPSNIVANFFGPNTLKSARENYKTVRTEKKLDYVKSSNSENFIKQNLFDKDLGTRWGSGLGRQSGNEWIEFYFRTQISAIGVELDPGNFVSDFPRGLKIKVGKSCDQNDLVEVSKIPDWQGSPLFSDSGLPYFSAQSNVKVFFDKDREFSCLRAEQIGKTDNFDWSIAELRLLVIKNVKDTKID